MHPQTVYAKTSKGVLDFKNKIIKLDRTAGKLFLSVDGKSTVTELVQKTQLEFNEVTGILDNLTAGGYIKVFFAPPDPAAAKSATVVPIAPGIARSGTAPPPPVEAEEMDLDFTSPAAVAKVNAEAEARKHKEAEAKARREAEARAKATRSKKQRGAARPPISR